MHQHIRLTITRDGVPVDADDTPVFSDETGTYGIRRLDTQEILVAAGTPMTQVGTGTYEYGFAAPSGTEAGAIVEYVQHFSLDQVPVWREGRLTVLDSAHATPTSPFHTYDQFIAKWGIGNVSTAANKDVKSHEPDRYAVQEAFNFARDTIYLSLRGGPYVVPLDFTPNNGQVPYEVQEWAKVLAFYWLYENRGWEERDRRGNKIRQSVTRVHYQMALVRSGVLQIPAVIGHSMTPVYATNVSIWGTGIRQPDEQPVYLGTLSTVL